MYENPPASYPAYPPPPSRMSGLGCFAKGCLTVIIVTMLLGVMLGGFGWYLTRNFMPFVSGKPETVRTFPATDAQYQAVQDKIAPFVQAVNAGQAATLSLSADDFNVLVARDPQFASLRGRVYLAIDHNALTADTSVPVNDASPGQQPVYFNGRVTFDASFAGGDFTLVLRRVEPLGGGASPSLVAWIIGHPDFSSSFSRGFNDSFHEALNKNNPAGAALINRLRTIIVKDNQIVITALGVPDTPVAVPHQYAVDWEHMFAVAEKPKNATRALLVGAWWKPQTPDEAGSLLTELGELVDTLGLTVADQVLAHIDRPQAAFLIGSGKAEEIVMQAKALECDVIIFDNELTPGQQRKFEELSGLAVIDREEVILDIFNGRARTREARLQVELARMEYSLPRLARLWGHLSRQQGGGLGGKGEGESQLEIDRRLTRKRIDNVKAELEEVRGQRATQRKQRQRTPVPNAAIVGYTNAGKSSLLKKLTGADVFVEDKLFATLDPTTRRIDLPGGAPLLLTDTVGFVRKLPHRLIEAFKATLEEALLSDFLVHVLDASQPEVFAFHKTTMDVLAELGAKDKHVITVFNKIDLLGDDDTTPNLLRRHFPDALFISTRTGQGLDELLARMADQLAVVTERLDLVLPADRSDLLSSLHRHGQVLATDYADDGIHVRAVLPVKFVPGFEPFRLPAPVRAGEATPPPAPVLTKEAA